MTFAIDRWSYLEASGAPLPGLEFPGKDRIGDVGFRAVADTAEKTTQESPPHCGEVGH